MVALTGTHFNGPTAASNDLTCRADVAALLWRFYGKSSPTACSPGRSPKSGRKAWMRIFR